ncbi:MAG: DUF1631 domain-containing protein [Sulfuritalea sp.]|nr:DUF1631 domain-containing protein [Sulfuritalea sp.]
MTEKDAATLAKLIAGCREQMESDLCELVEELGPKLIEDISARTDPAREPERRMAAVTLKPALSTNWAKVAPALKASLASRSRHPGSGYGDAIDLQIVSDAEMSQQLASGEVLDRLIAACREETNSLDRRITYMVLRTAMKQGDTSFKLASLWSCIETACGQVTSDAVARIPLLTLVGKRLAEELPQIYRVVNETLIDADILPRLKRSYRDVALVDPEQVAAESAKVTSALDRLVKARTKDGNAATAGPGDGSLKLFDSMKALHAAPPPAASGTHANIVRMARDSGAARDARPQDAVTLDIVAELFDLLFGDPHVADGIKALVARLQSTVLKAAMLNQRFFADRSHSARRFLDSISAIAIRWGKVVDAADPFYVKLAELVEKIHTTYDGDMAVFDAANAELDTFLAEREKIEEQQDHDLAEAVQASEEEIRSTRVAQMRAQRAATQRISQLLGPRVPIQIADFLRSYWRDVLQGRISQAGEDGAPTEETLQTAVALIWTVTPKHDLGERQRHAARLPGLLKKLNAGFDEIGTSPTERKTFMDTLVDMQLAALRAEKQKPPADEDKPTQGETPPARGAGPTLQVTHATGSGVRVQDISLPGASELDADSTPERSDLRRVRQLVRGDWVDFITAGQSRRERLTWINPGRTLLLFSNSAAACAISITAEALAARLRNKTATIVVPDRPMFERAIHGAIESLDKRAWESKACYWRHACR